MILYTCNYSYESPTTILDLMKNTHIMKFESSSVSAISGSSIQLADDYLDLSMPSYGDSSSSSAKPKSESNIPSFNSPFTDKDADREDVLQKKEDARAAREAEKAAKAQAAAERKAEQEAAAAQKKAEKEARREAEREKQRLAVERANQVKQEKADAAAAAAAASSEAPSEAPAVEEEDAAPEVKAPEFKAPEFKAPEFKAPDFKAPDFKTPDLSGFKAPDFKAPDFKAPDFKAPDFKAPDLGDFKAPEIKAPDFKTPDLSGFKAPDTSSFKAPDVKLPDVSIPKFSVPKMPDMPKVDSPSGSTPSFSTPSFSGSGSSSGGYASLDENVVDDQEERDVKAKEARTAFNEADASARVSLKKEIQLNRRTIIAIQFFGIIIVGLLSRLCFYNISFNVDPMHNCLDRKWRSRQRSCELKLMKRRKLRRTPRTLPAKHDSEVKSFVSDLLVLGIKLHSSSFSIILGLQPLLLAGLKISALLLILKSEIMSRHCICTTVHVKILNVKIPGGDTFAIRNSIFVPLSRLPSFLQNAQNL